MLRLRNGGLRWTEADIEKMSAVIGEESAVTLRSPYLPAILRLAAKKRLRISGELLSRLEDEEQSRVRLDKVRHLTDAWPLHKLERKAWPHQRSALAFFRAAQLDAYLNADKTGVGKTLTALLWAKVMCRGERNLIITKNIAKEQWADAIYLWLGKQEQVTIVEGTVAEQIELISKTKTGWVIGHWESLNHARIAYLRSVWDTAVYDEVQYIANRNALRSKTALKVRASYRMAATAHPFANDAAEMYTILRFLYPKTYTSYWRFFHMHVKARPRAFGGFDIEGVKRPKLLAWEIAPFTISRDKRQVFKTLPRITQPPAIRVVLSARGIREYDRMRKEIFVELDGLEKDTKILPIINDLARVTRMRQYLIDPGLVGAREPSVKYPAVYELVDQVAAPIVVFTEFKQAALRLGAYLKKQNRKLVIDYIHGGMQRTVRAKQRRFLAGDIDVMLVVYKAGDTALNLGGHGYVGHLDLPWTHRDLEQAQGRVDRPAEGTGKLVPTTAYRIVVKNSYEERMEARLVKKHKTFTGVFTVEDLRSLFDE